MNDQAFAELIAAAVQVRQHAHAKYSKFPVGAALQTAAGRVFTGCNVENASYGLTICAERAAVFAAVASGERTFTRLAVASVGGAAPCGACRQVLAEFAAELPILLIDVDRPQKLIEVHLSDLLPAAFTFPPSHDQAQNH